MGSIVDIMPPLGADPENDDCTLVNGTGSALVEGDCVMLDETKTGIDGTAASATNPSLGIPTAVRVTAAGDKTTNAAIACWAQESIAINGRGRFRIAGVSKIKTTVNVVSNTTQLLSVPVDGTFGLVATVATQKCVAKVWSFAALTRCHDRSRRWPLRPRRKHHVI